MQKKDTLALYITVKVYMYRSNSAYKSNNESNINYNLVIQPVPHFLSQWATLSVGARETTLDSSIVYGKSSGIDALADSDGLD